MSIIEHQNIKEFLSGLSNDTKRKQFVAELNSKKNKREEEMKNSTKHNFDAQSAWTKLHERLNDDGLLTAQKSKTVKLKYISRVAASIILILGLSLSAYYIFKSDKYNEIYAANEIKEVYLPDGTHVTLNRNSSIRFPNEFTNESREVEFKGEAFFEVKRIPEKPFIIKANNANVKVLGTSFNLISEKKNTELTVTTGKVQMAKESNLNENIILEVGDKGRLINDELTKEKNSNINYLSWKTKEFNYHIGVTLDKVFTDIEKVYNVDILIEDDEINSMPLNAVNHYDNYPIDTIFEIIFRIHPLKKEEKGDKIVISKEE